MHGCGGAGGLDRVARSLLTVGIVAAGDKDARLIIHLPLQVRILWHGLAAQALAVQKELDGIRVAIDAHVDWLAFLSRPVPVRQQMHHRLHGPPGLQQIRIVLEKPAGIEHSELRTDGRPVERGGFSAIVKSSPVEQARGVGSGEVVAPAVFDRGMLAVAFEVIRDEMLMGRVVEVNAAGVLG